MEFVWFSNFFDEFEMEVLWELHNIRSPNTKPNLIYILGGNKRHWWYYATSKTARANSNENVEFRECKSEQGSFEFFVSTLDSAICEPNTDYRHKMKSISCKHNINIKHDDRGNSYKNWFRNKIRTQSLFQVSVDLWDSLFQKKAFFFYRHMFVVTKLINNYNYNDSADRPIILV